MLTSVLFIVFAAVLVASSLLMILHRHPVPCALFMVVALCALAAIYVMLGAEFVGMVQIVVYAGAIMVLFLFVIMYAVQGQAREAMTNMSTRTRAALGWLVGVLLLVEGFALVGKRPALGPGSQEAAGQVVGNTEAVGRVLYTRYLFPFEMASLILLVAIVGVIVLAGKQSRGVGKRDNRQR